MIKFFAQFSCINRVKASIVHLSAILFHSGVRMKISVESLAEFLREIELSSSLFCQQVL